MVLKMKEIIIEKNSFDFDRFVDSFFEFLNDIYGIDPACLIQNVKSPCMTDKESCEKLQKRSAKDLLIELENDEQLYFPFTQAKISADSNQIKSIDGTKYTINTELEQILNEYDTVGYIVSSQDSKFIFKSGIHKVSSPNSTNVPSKSEEIQEIKNNEYEQFYKPMEKFLQSFIKK
jgi:hypothetical protein